MRSFFKIATGTVKNVDSEFGSKFTIASQHKPIPETKFLNVKIHTHHRSSYKLRNCAKILCPTTQLGFVTRPSTARASNGSRQLFSVSKHTDEHWSCSDCVKPCLVTQLKHYFSFKAHAFDPRFALQRQCKPLPNIYI